MCEATTSHSEAQGGSSRCEDSYGETPARQPWVTGLSWKSPEESCLAQY